MTAEKRKFTRFYYKMNAEIDVNDYSYQVSEIRSLSIGGCLLPVEVKGAPGDNCVVKILLSQGDEGPVVYIEGEITRIDDNSTAVKFVKIDPENLTHLHRIAQYNSPDHDKIEKEIKEHPGLF